MKTTATTDSTMTDRQRGQPMADSVIPGGAMRWPVIIMLVYIFLIICTPQVRFPIIAAISFEKILAAVWLLVVLFSKDKPKLGHAITTLLVLFYLLMLALAMTSEFNYSWITKAWVDSYWKKMFFFFLAILSLRDKRDLCHVLIGTAVIVFCYQLLSWRDFLSGGSYVYQQGMKRMMGMWTVPSYGAGNYWGSLSAFIFPIALYGAAHLKTKKFRYAFYLLIPILVASVVFSGSRGSFMSIVLFALFHFRRRLFSAKIIFAFILAIFVAFPLLPDSYKHRYSMIFVSKSEVNSGSRTEQLAKASAASRLQGMIDGWNIMLKYPLGVGPGASNHARLTVNDELRLRNEVMQLHNLYGQVFGEAGALGTLLLLLIWYQVFKINYVKPSDPLFHEKSTVLGMWVVLLVYGMASHHLYSDYFIWLYAFTVVIDRLSREAIAADESNTGRLTTHVKPLRSRDAVV